MHTPNTFENPKKNRLAPALTLVLLAPVIAEVLSGSTRLSFIFVLIPEIMVWGFGALIIREIVKRWGFGALIIREIVKRWKGGPPTLVLLALALSVAEESVIQQTSLAPLPWVRTDYGRLWHVNWIWFLFFLGYESVWVVLVPVQLTELIFRKHREDRWLSNVSLIVSAVIFLVGSFFAWFLWTHIARPRTFHVAKYQPPIAQLILGLLIISALSATAYLLRNLGKRKKTNRRVPPPWIAVVTALLLGIPWYGLIHLLFGAHHCAPMPAALIAGCIWAACAWKLIAYWTASGSWSDMHRLALCFGATIVVMLCGFSGSHAWPRIDLIAKIVLNLAALLGFYLLARHIRENTAPTNPTI